jgi:glycosyltransferase involved in cell wall biosynthesis
MRIVVLGGYSRSLLLFRGPLLRAMASLGHEVIACAPEDDPEVRQGLAEMGVQFVPVPLARAGTNIVKDLRSRTALVRIFQDLRPDIFLGYTIKPVVYGIPAARAAGAARAYGMVTGLGYAFTGGGFKRRLINRLVRTLYRKALGQADRVFFQNPDDLDQFKALRLVPADRTVLVAGSGVDLDQYRPSPLPSEPVFLLIARLLRDKGIGEYVEAAQQIKAETPEARFLLVGPYDPNPAAISPAEVEAWQREGAVEYLGEMKDVRDAIRRCRVYVLPSYREGTPRTVLEAMAMRRPIITTDAPGCRETVRHGENGLLVPVQDAGAVAEAMRRFVREPDLAERMAEHSLTIARQKYDVHKVNETILRAMELI